MRINLSRAGRTLFLAAILPISLLGAAPSQVQGASPVETGTVVRVVDGDTLDVSVPGSPSPTRVRVLGVDTPETVDPRRPVQCFGEEASARAKELLPPGQPVTLTVDPTQGRLDRYGRLLAYVGLPDGRDIGAALITEGYAHEYTYRTPYARQGAYRAAAAAAREAGAGLWAPTACAGAAETAAPAPGNVVADFAYGGPYDPAGPDRDCGDFGTWQEAQAFFLAAGGPDTDRHRLDQGGAEGIACEALTGSPVARR
jgi:micrococcal nuclease